MKRIDLTVATRGRHRRLQMRAFTFVAFGLLVFPITSNSALGQPPPKLVAQLGHCDDVSAIGFSEDGKWLVTASHDKSAILWEVATGKQIRVFYGHTDFISSVALSRDAKWLVTGSWDDTARLWEVATGEQIRAFRGSRGLVRSVALSRDAEWLVTGSGDAARLWEVATGKLLRVFVGHKQSVDAVAMSGDKKWLVTGGDGARLWDINTGKLVSICDGEPSGVRAAVISPDGKWLVLGTGEKAHLMELATGRLARIFDGHTLLVNAVAFSTDGRLLATGASDSAAIVWGTATGKRLRSFEREHGWVTGLAFSPDGKGLATSSSDKSAFLWDMATGKELRAFQTTAHRILRVHLSGDAKWLLATEDHHETAHLWDLASGKQARLLRQYVDRATFSDDSKHMVTSAGVYAKLWDPNTGQTIREFKHRAFVNALALTRDGKWLITGCGERGVHGPPLIWDMSARVWDLNTGKKVHTLKHPDVVSAVAVSNDGNRLLTGCYDGDARLWDIATAKLIRTFAGAGANLVFMPDGKRFVTSSWDPEKGGAAAYLWDIATDKKLRSFHGPSKITGLTVSEDGRRLVVTGDTGDLARGNAAWVFDVNSGKQIHVITDLYWSHGSGALSHDGKFLFTNQKDGTMRLWSMDDGRELCRLVRFRDGAWAVFDGEGRFDTADNANVANLHWVVHNQPLPLKRFGDSYYDPGLLAKYLNLNSQPLRNLATSR